MSLPGKIEQNQQDFEVNSPQIQHLTLGCFWSKLQLRDGNGKNL